MFIATHQGVKPNFAPDSANWDLNSFHLLDSQSFYYRKMTIEKNIVVAASYQLMVEGEIADMAEKDSPLVFIFGSGALLPDFETNIVGLSVGDTFDFTLTPEQGYGVHSEENLIELPIDLFIQDGERVEALQLGATLPMEGQNGEVYHGTVAHIGLEKVKMDFNHPLAGKTLQFSGEVHELREATAEELEHGHVHGPGGHQH